MLSLVPQEIVETRQWSMSYSTDELKRPLHYTYPPNGSLSGREAVEAADADGLLTGFYVTDSDPYILGDIDHVEDPENLFKHIPTDLALFLKKKKTYFEISPSGEGIRFLLKLPQASDKELLAGNVYYLRDGNLPKKSVQINVRPPWMTITRNPTNFSSNVVAETTLEELDKVFELKYKEEDVKLNKPITGPLPSINEMAMVLTKLPLDQNPRIKRAYKRVTGHEYEHYDYWLKVLMGVHHYATLASKLPECFELCLVWSEKDLESFSSEEDVLKKWKSFNEEDIQISYKTVFKFLYSYLLRWPSPKAQTKAERESKTPKKPLISEYSNFKALVEHFCIQLYRSETNDSEFYVTGDEDVLNKYFIMHRVSVHYDEYYGPFDHKTLVPAFHMFLQIHDFTGIGHGKVSEFLLNFQAETKRTVNLVRLYFDTPFKELPKAYRENEKFYDKSTFDFLFNCLTLDPTTDDEDELELYYTYYKSWLMGLVRNLYYADEVHMNNCILLLTGPEQIRKTSHFLYLLPSFMRDNISLTTHGFGSDSAMRDITKIAANSLVVVWDEIERYLNSQTESNFKDLIDAVPRKVVDKWQTIETTIRPKSIYGGTSNKREFKLSGLGSRRIFHIPVKWVDTDKMDRVCWHKIINDLKDECAALMKDNIVPWLLDEDELELQARLHRGIQSKTSVDLMLEEIFQFDQEFDDLSNVSCFQADRSGRLMTSKQVMSTMEQFGYSMKNVNRKGFENALTVACSNYTGTLRVHLEIYSPKCIIKKGMAYQGNVKRWVMPPLNKDNINSLWEGIE